MSENKRSAVPGGLAGWLLDRWRGRKRDEPRLALLERITLAPRQTIALVEVEGQRFLVASSPEGAPAFHALDGRRAGSRIHPASAAGRVSW